MNYLFLIICMIIFPLVVTAQTTIAMENNSAVSGQTGTPTLNASEIPGAHSIQSYVDHINPAALAAQLAPIFSLLGAALVALAGLVLMLQAKKTAVRMFVTGIGCVVIGSVPGLLVPVFLLIKSMPVWLTMIIAFFISLSFPDIRDLVVAIHDWNMLNMALSRKQYQSKIASPLLLISTRFV